MATGVTVAGMVMRVNNHFLIEFKTGSQIEAYI